MLTYTPAAGTPVVVAFDDDPDTPLIWRFDTIVLRGAEWERHLLAHRCDGYDYNPETFPPAIIAASVTGWTVTRGDTILEQETRAPTLDEAQELWSSWPQWARMRLLRSIEVQNVTGLSLGKARGRTNAKRAPATAATT